MSDPDGICRSAAGFYKEPTKIMFFEGLSQVQPKKALEVLTAEELQAEVFGLKSDKAPGIDGLPADFYKSFWSFELQQGRHHAASQGGRFAAA